MSSLQQLYCVSWRTISTLTLFNLFLQFFIVLYFGRLKYFYLILDWYRDLSSYPLWTDFVEPCYVYGAFNILLRLQRKYEIN